MSENKPGTNSGHGHVWERPDGVKARCGGPALCAECLADVSTLAQEGWQRVAELEKRVAELEAWKERGAPYEGEGIRGPYVSRLVDC